MLSTSVQILTLLVAGASTVSAVPTERGLPSIVRDVPNYAYQSCYTDVIGHGLSISLGKTNGTVEGCAAAGLARSPPLALVGVTNDGDCYGSTGTKVQRFPVFDLLCRAPCKGDKKEACGGKLNMAVYKYYSAPVVKPIDPVPNDPVKTTDPVDNGTPVLDKPVPVTKKVSTYPRWSYKACYSDDLSARSLINLVTAENWSVESCLKAAQNARYSYAGLEYGGECWGSDRLEATANLLTGDNVCTMTCNDNAAEECGGDHQLGTISSAASHLPPFLLSSLETDGSSSSLSSSHSDVYVLETASTKVKSLDGVTYQGCYTDAVDARTLANLVTVPGTQTWDAAKCLAAVKAAGYSYGGIIYGGECWGANELASTASPLDAGRCAWPCNDQNSYTCGGQAGLDVYTIAQTAPAADA
ncbi:hypothetical protein JCM8547_008475 [Rhodosporidiobolus lusitaniae]